MSDRNNVLLDMALSLARQGDHVEARRLVRQVLDRDPNDEIAWAMSARLAKSEEEAIACWQEVARLRPDDPAARAELVRLGQDVEIPTTQPETPLPSKRAAPRPTKQIPVFDPTVREAPATIRLPKAEVLPATGDRPIKQCPYCAEIILEEAIKCRFCGSDLSPQRAPDIETILFESHESRRTLNYWLLMIFTLGLYQIAWRNKSIMVTTERIIWKMGVLSRTEKNIPLDKVQDITVRRGLLGAMLGYGSLIVETAGSVEPEIVFENIGEPDNVKEFILLAVQRRRSRG